MWPVVENLVKDNLSRRKEAETKCRQAQVVSTAVLSELKEQDLASGSVAAVAATLPSTSAVQSDGDSRPQDNVLATNQKLGLVCALLEIGEWDSAKDLMDRMPEFYAVSSSERIAKAMIRLVHWKIQAFYKQKCSSSNAMGKATEDKKNATGEDKKSLKKKRLRSALEADDMDVDATEGEIHVEPIAQVHSWDGLVEAVFPLLHYLGPYLGYSAIVLSKVIRLLAVLMKNKDSKLVSRLRILTDESQVVDVVDQSVLPALTLLDGNCVISEELWSLIGQFPYTTRYRLYGHWVTEHTNRHPALLIMKGVVTGKTKYVMKRLAKETVRIVGRQLGKLCHTHPAVVFDHLLNQIQTFENFIGPVVDSVRYLTHLEFDVFSYCIIQHLASPEKQKLKVRDVTLSPWLQSLATFVGTVFKRYNMELTAVLQYVANQLKDGHSFDLLVLREVVQNMSGIETTSGLTSEQLEALAGGDILRQEGGYFGQSRNVKRTTNRLRDALYQQDLVLGLCILTAQQRGSIVHKESEGIHLKLTGQMFDQCQDTLIQFGSFLTTNLKADDYIKRMPTAPQLLIDYHVSTDAAMFLSRPIYRSQILSRYGELKKQEREKQKAAAAAQNAEDQQQSNVMSKNPEWFRQSFNETVGRLVEKMVSLYPEHIWADISPRLFVTFWVLSMYDLFLPEDSYEREVDKIRKQVDEVASSRELSDSRRRKEKERLQQLETKLKTEEASQKNHVARVVQMLEHEKDSWFTSAKTQRAEQVVRFIQTCVMPRCLFADLDAIYCVKFVELMHQLRTPKFPTILFLDRFLVDVTTLVPGLSENEATYFGRFLNALLKLIARWHADRTVYEKECAGSPGFVTRYRNDQESAVDYESFRNVTYKWHHRLSKAFINMMTMKSYACRRNALYVLMKMLPTFPVVDMQYSCILKGAEDLRDTEKNQRQDLHILATSYWGHLKQRKTPQVVPQDEFHIMKNRKATVSRANPTAASTGAPVASESAKPPSTEAKDKAASPSVTKTAAAKRTADKGAHNQAGLSNTEKRHEAGTAAVNRTTTATKRTVTTATVEAADKAVAVQNGPGPKKKKQNGSVGEKSNQEGSVLPPTHRKIRLQSHGSAATAAGVQQSSTTSGKTSSSAPSKTREDGVPAATTAEALSADGRSKDSTTRKSGGATSTATAASATSSSGTTAIVDEPEEGEEGEIRQSPMPHHSSNTRTILAGPATAMSRPVEPPASSSTKKRPSASPNERSSSAKKRLRKEQKNETTGHRSREASHDRTDKKRIRASSSRGKEDVVAAAAVTLVAAEASKSAGESVSPADGRYGGRHAKEPSSEHRHRHSGPSSAERTKLAKRSKKEDRRSRGQSAESRRSAKQR